MHNQMQLDIVSAEGSIFAGSVTKMTATGSEGVLQVFPGHMPLLTPLKPGYVRLTLPSNKRQMFYVSGGFLEVQPEIVTVLADTAIHAEDLDQQAALHAKERAEKMLQGKQSTKQARQELAIALAQLRVIRMLRQHMKQI
jgi:F-type H+-transporting ATPase subunit epsilon